MKVKLLKKIRKSFDIRVVKLPYKQHFANKAIIYIMHKKSGCIRKANTLFIDRNSSALKLLLVESDTRTGRRLFRTITRLEGRNNKKREQNINRKEFKKL